MNQNEERLTIGEIKERLKNG